MFRKRTFYRVISRPYRGYPLVPSGWG